MAIQGADLAQLQNLVKQLAGPMSSQLEGVLNSMNTQVQASQSYWVAANADKFRTEFAQFVQKSRTQLQQILQDAAKASGQNLAAIQHATGSAV